MYQINLTNEHSYTFSFDIYNSSLFLSSKKKVLSRIQDERKSDILLNDEVSFDICIEKSENITFQKINLSFQRIFSGFIFLFFFFAN